MKWDKTLNINKHIDKCHTSIVGCINTAGKLAIAPRSEMDLDSTDACLEYENVAWVSSCRFPLIFARKGNVHAS